MRSLVPGELIDHYEIIRFLGEGGMGCVYLARDTELERQVALKFLNEADRDDETWLHEARTIARLGHPHIVTLFGVGKTDGLSYLILEYIEGETLRSLLINGPLPPED